MTIEGGGGVSHFSVFTVAVNTSAILENLTISNGYTSGDGGGIHNYGTLTVSNSTLCDNSVNGTKAAASPAVARLTVSNSTLYDNWGSSCYGRRHLQRWR